MSKVESYLLGMDCGTTNLKAIILGEDGTVVAEASRPSTFMDLKSDMREQDANEWWSNTVEIFKSLVEQAGHDIVKNQRYFHQFTYSYHASGGCRGKSPEKWDYMSGQPFYRGIALYCRDNRL